eukprot:CAMPEP_0175131046 /NCGR_PEP_ID=MMETSP0087-20121206/6327_1 /TAXON_ID=136419 /ORGANISM="Unknown Unknown, Strain D1" /LENGTH=240 /DNA_ID=CAMNT_0016413297 /DNA_START=260 /DNA_END=982 /DNA_ORIENTATION=-
MMYLDWKTPNVDNKKGEGSSQSLDEKEEVEHKNVVCSSAGEGTDQKKQSETASHQAINNEIPVPVHGSTKFACFDFDGCLAKTSLFERGPDAWSLLHPCVPDKLRELYSQGFSMVIMTNQSDIGKAAKPETRQKAILEKTGRLESFVAAVGIDFLVLVAAGKAKDKQDKFRKPAAGMWTWLTSRCDQVDRDQSFFVGDAAGRKGDHSDTDKRFADAAGLKFFTEDFFTKSSTEVSSSTTM